jgi:ComF family protein
MESVEGLVKSAGLLRQLNTSWLVLARGLVDMLYPPVCLHCDAPLSAPDTICPNCFKALRFITAPRCPVMGTPFEVAMGEGALSAEAIAEPPPFGRCRSALVYNEVAGALVSRLKYGDRVELARFCGHLMVGAGHELWGEDAVLVPIPLHASRLRTRRYNQSAELALAISKCTGLTVASNVLFRKKKTRQQVGLSGAGRAKNVSGAFEARLAAKLLLKDRRVILVDDVYTTGATVKAACRALKRAGVKSIDVVTLARVVIGTELPI